MRFTPSFLEEIKARLPVSEVVRRRVKIVKAGREWKGLSPFSAEKTPSFFVNDQKMAWFDFSSGQNGNIFDFVMRTEGLSFPEAVEKLAREAGWTCRWCLRRRSVRRSAAPACKRCSNSRRSISSSNCRAGQGRRRAAIWPTAG